ncbi:MULTISPECIES: hypothetical protein [Streptomyces]|uniref:hypothetical protein n=1 Tax=Streptomyces TaxID=1883 RepID=UPI002E2DD8EB|nr:hypothetical protein [Streptomyces sp. NBC_00334]
MSHQRCLPRSAGARHYACHGGTRRRELAILGRESTGTGPAPAPSDVFPDRFGRLGA